MNIRFIGVVVLTACLAFWLPTARAQSLGNVGLYPGDTGMHGTGGFTNGGGAATSGFAFQVTTPIEVTALGSYIFPSDPPGSTATPGQRFIIGIYQYGAGSPPPPLVSVSIGYPDTVPTITLSTNVAFMYASVTPTLLVPGITYEVSEAETAGINSPLVYVAPQPGFAPGPEITGVLPVSGANGGFPGASGYSANLGNPGDNFYFGPDFFYMPAIEAVPEPASWIAASLAGLMLIVQIVRARRFSKCDVNK